MDNLSFKKSTENVVDNEENSSTTAFSDIINNVTTAELDEVDLRNGINEFHPSEVLHINPYLSYQFQLINSLKSFYLIDSGCSENFQINCGSIWQ